MLGSDTECVVTSVVAPRVYQEEHLLKIAAVLVSPEDCDRKLQPGDLNSRHWSQLWGLVV